VQNDIKKVLAYSTISQLGYMIMAMGVGAVGAGFFHLCTHAMFKACLFLGSGSVIHGMHHSLHELHDHHTDPQDMRNMGGLGKKMKVTSTTFLIACLAISGVPLFSGFMSKDEILGNALAYGTLRGGIAALLPWVGFLVAGMTAFYMFRLWICTFKGEPKKPEIFAHIHESPIAMKIPLIVLATLSIFVFWGVNPIAPTEGWFLKNWIHTPANVAPLVAQPPIGKTEAHETALPAGEAVAQTSAESAVVKTEPAPFQEAVEQQTENVHWTGMGTSVVLAGLGILLAFGTYSFGWIDPDKVLAAMKPVHTFLYNKWYFDDLYEKIFPVAFVLLLSKGLNLFDKYVVDGAVNGTAWITVLVSSISAWFDRVVVDGSVNLIAGITQFFGVVFRITQTGKVQTYLAWVVFGVLAIFFWFKLF
ncbi:MAG TPA: proton-conducting transporter membrane subunit, partial [Candidatus Kapabacteria bacterium]|nr:proton-conducting transporter membrane subunit [Candidatus Kapabacteria bacterium]